MSSIIDLFSKRDQIQWPNPQFLMDLVAFTEENFIFGSVYDLDFVAFLTIVLGKELTAKIR